jgi:hypothetical protein
MRKTFLACICVLPFLTACEVLFVSTAAIMLSQEFTQNARVAFIPEESDMVWLSVKSSMSHMSLEPIHVDNDLRAAQASIDGAQITVHVETYEVGETQLSVAAKKLGLYNGKVADDVLMRLRRDMDDE